MLRKYIFERGILLDQQSLPSRIDAVQIVARGLVRRRKSGAAKHHQHRHRPVSTSRRDQRHVDTNADGGIG